MLRKLLLLTLFGVGVAACGVETQHQYVQSDDGRLSFRLPHEFTDVGLESPGLNWAAGLDGNPQPDLNNGLALMSEFPFVLAQSINLSAEGRSLVSQEFLRTLAIPALTVEERRDPLDAYDDVSLIFHEPFVDELGFEGHVLQIELDVEGGLASEVQVVALSPDRTAYHRVRIACAVECMSQNEDLVADILSSIAMREADE